METRLGSELRRVACLASLLAAGCRGDANSSKPPGSVPPDLANAGPDAALEASDSPLGSVGSSGGQSSLCRSDRDCPIDETCCPSGLLGICSRLDDALGCPAPDLTLAIPADFRPHFEDRFVYEDDCLLQRCLGGRGARRLMMFPVDLANRGDGHMILALRDVPGVRRISCDGSLFLDDFLRYELIDAEGVRRAGGAGDVGLACQLAPSAQSTSPFDCQTLGLEAHSYRALESAADCQWVDVTTLPSGQYTLRLSVNADGRFAEGDLGNNTLERKVTIPDKDPLAPCEDEVPEDIGFGEGIECGWELMPGQTGVACVPNELVSIECTYCNGAYVPRACPGVQPCSAGAELRFSSLGSRTELCSSEHVCDGFGQCTDFGSFSCPASGLYTLLGFPTAPILPMGSAPRSAPSTVTCQRAEPSGPFVAGTPPIVGPSAGPGDAGAAAP